MSLPCTFYIPYGPTHNYHVHNIAIYCQPTCYYQYFILDRPTSAGCKYLVLCQCQLQDIILYYTLQDVEDFNIGSTESGFRCRPSSGRYRIRRAACWRGAIECLLHFVQSSDNVHLEVSTFQAIGYICETIVSCVSLTSK